MSSRRLVYQQGDHICTLYNSPEEQLRAAIEYIKGGLGRGERCLYVCGEHTPTEMRAALQAAGIEVKSEEKRGALILITKAEAHLKGGTFSADKMITMLHQAVQDALDAGFKGFALPAIWDGWWIRLPGPSSWPSMSRASINFMPRTGHSVFVNTAGKHSRTHFSTTASRRTGSFAWTAAPLRWRIRFMKSLVGQSAEKPRASLR